MKKVRRKGEKGLLGRERKKKGWSERGEGRRAHVGTISDFSSRVCSYVLTYELKGIIAASKMGPNNNNNYLSGL